MRNFQDTFEIRKGSFISAFSICMTVPLSLRRPKDQQHKAQFWLINMSIYCKLLRHVDLEKRSSQKTKIPLTEFGNGLTLLTLQVNYRVLVIFFLLLVRTSHRRCSIRKNVLKNFAKFTRKQLYQTCFCTSITLTETAALQLFCMKVIFKSFAEVTGK